MTDDQIEHRFASLRLILTSAWQRRLIELSRGCAETYLKVKAEAQAMQAQAVQAQAVQAQAVQAQAVQAQAVQAQAVELNQVTPSAQTTLLRDEYFAAESTLRSYLRTCSQHIVQVIDNLICDVPCTRYTRVRYMDVLTGTPKAWGTPFDLNERADQIYRKIEDQADRSDLRAAIDVQIEIALKEGNRNAENRAKEEREALRQLEGLQFSLLRRPLLTEVLSILQHMSDARAQWEKAPVRAGNFQDQLGADRFPKLEAIMHDLGIAPREGKGKNNVVAAYHAAFEHFRLQLPEPGQWPRMLSATYPGTTWSAKCKPEQRPTYRSKAYKEAFSAVKDRLQ
jgi:hypothetical protein